MGKKRYSENVIPASLTNPVSEEVLTCTSEIEGPELPLIFVSRTVFGVGPKGNIGKVVIHNQADAEPFMRRFGSGDDHVVAFERVRRPLEGLNLATRKCALTPRLSH